MTRVGRAVERGETRGMMQILIDVSEKSSARRSDGGDEAIHSISTSCMPERPTRCSSGPCTFIRQSRAIPTLLEDLAVEISRADPASLLPTATRRALHSAHFHLRGTDHGGKTIAPHPR
jgi:hypothetical protein